MTRPRDPDEKLDRLLQRVDRDVVDAIRQTIDIEAALARVQRHTAERERFRSATATSHGGAHAADELVQYVGADAAMALTRWAAMTGRELRIPAGAWRGTGYTGAVVVPLFVTEPGLGSRLVLAKALPPGKITEAAAHRRAVRDAPPAFRSHLVDVIGDPIATPGGGAVMFQALAGDSRDWRPLADVPSERLGEACEALTRALIEDWNPDFRVETFREIDVLRTTLTKTRSGAHFAGVDVDLTGADSSPWLRVDGDDPVPNPITLLTDPGRLGDRRVDIAVGRTHGDLHGQNVLLEQHDSRIATDTFRLIDLMTYEDAAPLDRDPVTMLLSVTAGLLPDLSPSQRTLLLRVFVQPEADVPAALPPLAVAPLQAIFVTAAKLLSRAGAELWRRQYLLSLVAHGLMFTTFTNLGPENRWWFLRLAGHAAGKLLSGQSPAEVGSLTPNPFPDAATERASRPAPPTAPTGRHRYGGRVKVLVCRRLADDWRDLATYLDIPSHEQTRFRRGDEAREIWDWLERRRRLPVLALALREIGRTELAELLDHDGTDDE